MAAPIDTSEKSCSSCPHEEEVRPDRTPNLLGTDTFSQHVSSCALLAEIERTIRVFRPVLGATNIQILFRNPLTGREELFAACVDPDILCSEKEMLAITLAQGRTALRRCPGMLTIPLNKKPQGMTEGRCAFHFCRPDISRARVYLAHIFARQVEEICENFFLRMLLVCFPIGRPPCLQDSSPSHSIVGQSRAVRELRATIARIASSDAPILITGETGAGKELVARAIHDTSPRAQKAFVAENCSAIPDALVESELFGYARGAYTGASSARPGLFERAHGGTFFLDEIGETTLGLQAKLLRVMDEKTIRRLGENVVRRVDVRFVSATNRDLKVQIQKKEFRRDLYYRLRAIEVWVPALRERWEDDGAVPAFADLQPSDQDRAVAGDDVLAADVVLDLVLLEVEDELLEAVAKLAQPVRMRRVRLIQPRRRRRLEEQEGLYLKALREGCRQTRRVRCPDVIRVPPRRMVREGQRVVLLPGASNRYVGQVLVDGVDTENEQPVGYPFHVLESQLPPRRAVCLAQRTGSS